MNLDSFLISLLLSLLTLIASLGLPVGIPQKTAEPKMKPKVATPSASLINASTSATATIPQSYQPPAPRPQPPVPWGQTEKVGDHLYRTYVGSDQAMGTPDEILTALNNYRKNHGQGSLQKDDGLCRLAQSRAVQQDKNGGLDNHKGLIEYMNDPNHWRDLGIIGIGENASYGYILSGVHLIEWVFDSDTEHRQNQLDPKWNIACTGTSQVTVDILFATRQ